VVVAALGKDLIVCLGFAVIYLTTGRIYINPRPLGKWCTATELFLVPAMLMWPVLPVPLERVPQALWIVTAILAVLAAIDYIRDGNHYIISVNASRRDGTE